MNPIMLGEVLPKLYVITHLKTPYRVVFVGPEGQRVQKHFKNQSQAKAYHRELLAKARLGGTAGLIMDRVMRAEYFAAKELLGDVPLMTAVR